MKQKVEEKKVNKLAVIITLLAAFFICVMFLGAGFQLEYNADSFTIKAKMWSGRTVSYADIDKIEYCEQSAASGSRTYGYGDFSLKMGNFKNTEYGNYIRYTNSKCASSVVLTLKDTIVVVNGQDVESTKEIYEELMKRVTVTTEVPVTDSTKEQTENSEEEQPSNSTMELTLPEEGMGGCILASGEQVTAPDGTKSIVLSDEPNAEFLFSSGEHLRNLQMISLSYDGAVYQQLEYVYNCYDFEKQEVLKVSCYLPDTYSNLMLQYEDPTGEFFCYFVCYDMSAEQPAIVLMDAMNADITLL